MMTYNHATEQYEIETNHDGRILTVVPRVHTFDEETWVEENAEALLDLWFDHCEQNRENTEDIESQSQFYKSVFNTTNRNAAMYKDIVWAVPLED
jgi:hypothetical protein